MDEKNRIFYVQSSRIDFVEVFKLKLFMMFHKKFSVAIDMKMVKNIEKGFLDFIKLFSNKNKLSLINLNSNVMAALGLVSYDKYVNIYATESDFYENRRAIVNRKFRVF